MLLALLIHGYATGRSSSRQLEAATQSDVAVRHLTANPHPDHDTICTFRRARGPSTLFPAAAAPTPRRKCVHT